MPPRPRSQLGNSWVVDDADEGNISWAEESDGSIVDETSIQTRKPQSKTHTPQRTDDRTQGTSTASEFIMPSLGESPAQRHSTFQPSRSKPATRVPKTPQSRTTTSRSITARTTKSYRVNNGPSFFTEAANFILDLLGKSLRNLKTPISWVISAYLLFGGLIILRNIVTSSISNALSPICRLPGVYYLNLPICTYTSPVSDHPTIQGSQTSNKGSADPEFDSLMTVQAKFDSLLSDSSTSLSLPLDMKRSEASIRDLRQVVRFSTISSKNELLHEFDGFIETARIASFDLQKFNSHVGRSVDNVLATARWTERVLNDIAAEKANRGILPAFVQDTILAPFQPLQFTEARLLDQYIQHSRIVSDEIERLISEAQALLLVLNNLEDRLDVIHHVSLRDNLAAKTDRDEILAQLWTIFGGNKAKLGKVSNQLALLTRVGQYRKLAYAHVSGTVIKLQSMGAELEELRERVGSAEVLRDRGVGGVPLAVHVETIRLGVERLEGQREKAREVERGMVRRVVEAGERGGDSEMRLLVDA